MTPAFTLLLIISLIIGLFGRYRKMGFWGYFLASVFLTPIIGLLLLFASDPRPQSDSCSKKE